jgi:hypothetical protein
MISQVKKVLEQLENLPANKQLEIARLIEDELNWDDTFEQSQEQLSNLAREASEEYSTGETSDDDW